MKRKYVYAIICILAAASAYLVFFAPNSKTEAASPIGVGLYAACMLDCALTGAEIDLAFRDAYTASCGAGCEFFLIL